MSFLSFVLLLYSISIENGRVGGNKHTHTLQGQKGCQYWVTFSIWWLHGIVKLYETWGILMVCPFVSTPNKGIESYIQGPIAHLKVFGRSYIYLNDYQTMVDLFEKRGNIYSSRPHLVMNDLWVSSLIMGLWNPTWIINPKRQGWNDWFIIMFPYGPELRKSRQKLHQFLQKSVVRDYYPFQIHSAYRLAELLIKDPENFADAVK